MLAGKLFIHYSFIDFRPGLLSLATDASWQHREHESTSTVRQILNLQPTGSGLLSIKANVRVVQGTICPNQPQDPSIAGKKAFSNSPPKLPKTRNLGGRWRSRLNGWPNIYQQNVRNINSSQSLAGTSRTTSFRGLNHMLDAEN